MPELIIPIITLATTGIGIGETLSNQPSAPKPASTTPTVTPAQAIDTSKQQQNAEAAQFPNIQSLTGGSLSPEAKAQMSLILSGQAGQPGSSAASQDLLLRLFGINAAPFTASAGNNPAGTPTTPTGLADGYNVKEGHDA